MSTPPTEVSDLLAYALFDVDERARQLKEPLHVFLVSLALFKLDRAADREEIHDAVCAELPTSGLTQNEVEQAVASAVKAGFLQKTAENEVALAPGRREQLAAASERLASSRDAFHSHLRACIERELDEALSIADAEAVEAALETFLQTLFHDRSVALADAFGPGGRGFDSSTELLPAKSLSTIAATIAPPGEKLRRAQVIVGLRNGLLDMPDPARTYLAAEYQKTIAFALLQQDPSVARVKRQLARQRVPYLDTNVVMAWLFSAHPQHEEALEAVEAGGIIGCRNRLSKFTLDELARQMREADEAYSQLTSIPDELLAIIDDDIIRTFHYARKNSPGLTWTAFYAERYPPADYLRERGFIIDESRWAEAVQDPRKATVCEEVRTAKARRVPSQLVDFDAHNLLYVQVLRRSTAADEMGNRVWFVTLDRSLRAAERRLIARGTYSVPSSMRAHEWCSYMTPVINPDSETLKSYVTHLVQSQLDLLAEDPAFVDTNFLVTLQQAPFDSESLLSGAPEQVRRVLVALQEQREVNSLLERPPADASETEEWIERLQGAVEEAVSAMQEGVNYESRLDALQQERDEAKQASVTLRRERDRGLRRIAELEHAVDALARSDRKRDERWWARMLSIIRLRRRDVGAD